MRCRPSSNFFHWIIECDISEKLNLFVTCNNVKEFFFLPCFESEIDISRVDNAQQMTSAWRKWIPKLVSKILIAEIVEIEELCTKKFFNLKLQRLFLTDRMQFRQLQNRVVS